MGHGKPSANRASRDYPCTGPSLQIPRGSNKQTKKTDKLNIRFLCWQRIKHATIILTIKQN